MTHVEETSFGRSGKWSVPQRELNEGAVADGDDDEPQGTTTQGALRFKVAKSVCLIVTWFCMVSSRFNFFSPQNYRHISKNCYRNWNVLGSLKSYLAV